MVEEASETGPCAKIEKGAGFEGPTGKEHEKSSAEIHATETEIRVTGNGKGAAWAIRPTGVESDEPGGHARGLHATLT